MPVVPVKPCLVINLGAPPERWSAFIEQVEASASEDEKVESETRPPSPPVRTVVVPRAPLPSGPLLPGGHIPRRR